MSPCRALKEADPQCRDLTNEEVRRVADPPGLPS